MYTHCIQNEQVINNKSQCLASLKMRMSMVIQQLMLDF